MSRMIDKATIQNPSTHYGAARKSTRTFLTQRVTGALNILFLGFLIWLVVSLAGADRAQMVATISNPMVAVPLALLLVNVAIHMRIGMHEVIDDYVTAEGTHRLSSLANTAFAVLIALVGVGAIIKIVFWG
jgi:succinate dehydrogenase / fumarate reductase membrane anchor subunit